MKILGRFHLNLIKLLALGHVAVVLFSCYYCYFLFSHRQQAAANITQFQPPPYDFLYFIQAWPGSYHPPPTDIPVNFAVLGLWPMYEDGTYPKDCNDNDPLDIEEIKDLVPQLDKEMPALATSKNEKLWKRQWARHGTCSVLDKEKYFNTILRLKGETKILKNLEDKEITPDGRFYSVEFIQTTLKNVVGVNPGIRCNTNGQDPTSELREIYFCVDTKGENFIECPFIKADPLCGEDKNPDIKFTIYEKYVSVDLA